MFLSVWLPPEDCRSWPDILIRRLRHLRPLLAGGGRHHQPRAEGPGVRHVGHEGLKAAVVLQVVVDSVRGGGGGGGQVYHVVGGTCTPNILQLILRRGIESRPPGNQTQVYPLIFYYKTYSLLFY